MTGKETYERWRRLSFWPRLGIECALCIVIAFFVELVFSRQSADLAEAILSGALLGIFFAVIDHAFFFGGPRTRHWS